VDWLSALPLLHFLRQDSEPFGPVDCENTIDVTKLKWWGLQELPYRDIRKRLTQRFAGIFIEWFVCYNVCCHLCIMLVFLNNYLIVLVMRETKLWYKDLSNIFTHFW
jgi:hypothetical protein